jgi:hypothetical protein
VLTDVRAPAGQCFHHCSCAYFRQSCPDTDVDLYNEQNYRVTLMACSPTRRRRVFAGQTPLRLGGLRGPKGLKHWNDIFPLFHVIIPYAIDGRPK